MDKDAFSEYGSESKQSSQSPVTEEGAPEGKAESIHIPAEFLQGTKFKPGDELVLKVISADEEGLEVEYASPAEGGGEGEMSANDEIDSMAAASANY